MKFCPVCKSNVFDDMDTCFNCLHKFSSDGASSKANCDVTSESSKRADMEFEVCKKDAGLTDFLSHYYDFLGQYIQSRKLDLQHQVV